MSRYRDNAGEFTATNTTILGISVDSEWANLAFRQQLGAEFPILSDFKKEVARRYGVLDEATGYARRVTFVIDKAGVVRHIDQGADALDPKGALGVCRLISKER